MSCCKCCSPVELVIDPKHLVSSAKVSKKLWMLIWNISLVLVRVQGHQTTQEANVKFDR